MRIVVVTPPFFVPSAPASAPSILTAMLRRAGHEAINFDVSRYCVDRLLQPDLVRRSIERASSSSALRPFMRFLPYIIDESVSLIRRTETYDDLRQYERARLTLETTFLLHANAHGASRWSSTEYFGDHDREDGLSIARAVTQGGEIPDAPLDEAADQVADFAPDLVALSVSFPEQLYGALRLAAAIRKRCGARVVLGGATVTRVRAALPSLGCWFDHVDYIILREGELPLLALVQALRAEIDPLTVVPGLLIRVDGVVRSSTVKAAAMTLQHMPVPEFDDLVAGPYLAPRPFLPVSTTRNCYFDKCTFCAISRSFVAGFRQMPPVMMAEQIETLLVKHPGALFKDVSEALSPRVLWKFCDAMRSVGPVSWEAYLRFEKPFCSAAAANRLRQGGLAVAYFGLESGAPEQLEEVYKQIDVGVAERTLRHFADAGIWNHVFIISGLPRETEAHHEATMRFIEKNRAFIHSVQVSQFRLELDSNAEHRADEYGFRPAIRPPTSVAVDMKLDALGTIPKPEIARRRVRELRSIAYGANDTLGRSCRVWDGHKVMFTARHGAPVLPDSLVDIERPWSQILRPDLGEANGKEFGETR